MERFIVSARKYRPDSFESLIGQDNIATTLKNSVVKKQLAHAYLFCGPRGVGKTSAARIFAKTINCSNPGEQMEPCGQCESCISFANNRSYSIHELDAASNNSVEDIRQLNELVRIPPQIGKYSVYIIDEVHMLSQSAFNAFLKTLEEPPAHAIFILATTEKHKILPTILSRCQTYDFNRISVEDIVKNLTDIAAKEEVSCDLEAMHVIAQKADGAMRDALTIFDQAVAFCGKTISYESVISSLNVLDYDYYIQITKHMLKGEHSAVLLIFDQILSKGFNALHFIGGLSAHFRNLLICKDKSTLSLLELAPSLVEKYKEQAIDCSLPFLYDALNIASACESGYKNSGHPRLHIELSLLKLCQINSPSWAEEKVETKTESPTVAIAKPQAKTTVEVQAEAKPETPATASVQSDTKKETLVEIPTQPVAGAAPSLSIKNLIKSAGNKEKSNSTKGKTEVGTDIVEIEKLNNVWLKMAEAENALPRLSSAISQTNAVIRDNSNILFPVRNEMQKSWIDKYCKARLVEFLKVNLNNKNITLDVEVTPDDEGSEKKPYTSTEKAKFISDNYPEVKEMQKDLKLELK